MRAKLTLLLALLLFTSFAFASTIDRNYTFQNLKITADGDYDFITMEGMPSHGEPGEPVLPVYTVTILLPPGEELQDVVVSNVSWNSIDQIVKPRPGGQIFPLSDPRSSVPTLIPNTEIYNGGKTFPENIVTDVMTGYLRGFAIASFLVHPVRWDAQTGQLQHIDSINLNLISDQTERGRRGLNLLRISGETVKMVKNVTTDLEFINSYGNLDELDELPGKFLIICDEDHVNAWEEYVEFKTMRGIETYILTTQDIYSSYNGVDNAQKIHNCLFSEYYINDASHLLLAGDVNYVPYRALYAEAGGEGDHIPADVYFAGLDDTWNDDNDQYWGEPNEADLYQELTVGRAPVTSTAMIGAWIDKMIRYQTAPVLDQVTEALMVGEDLGWECWGGEYKNEVAEGSSAHGYTTAGFTPEWNINTLYDMNSTWNTTQLFNLLSNGVHYVNHLGHANTTYALKAVNSQMNGSNLSNYGLINQYYLLYTQGCYCGAFDDDCIIERWQRDNYGAFATISNSRYGWGDGYSTDGPSQAYDRQFFDAIFSEDLHRVGEVNRDSKHDNIPSINGSCMRWCFYEINLFGDPTVDMYSSNVGELEVELPEVHAIGDDQMTIVAQDVAGAIVTVSRNGEVIAVAETDIGGVAVVPAVVEEPGTLDVTIIAHNYLPYEGTVEAVTAEGGFPIIDHISVNDSDLGNGNNEADFGENILLNVTIRNVGQDPVNTFSMVAQSANEWVNVSNQEMTFTDLPAGGTTTLNLEVSVDALVPDLTDANISFEMTTDELTRSEDFELELHAPVLSFGLHSVDDSQAGDGNQRLAGGESAMLDLSVNNSGSSDISDAVFTVTVSDPYITVENNTPITTEVLSEGEAVLSQIIELTASEDIPNPSRVWLQITATHENGFQYSALTMMDVGGFLDNCEAGDQGMNHYSLNNSEDQWHVSVENNWTPSGSHCWKLGQTFNGDYGSNLDACLELPVIERTGEITLSFIHSMDAEISIEHAGQCYDGGRVEISPDGTNWYAMPMDGYNYSTRGDLSMGAGNMVYSGSIQDQYQEVNIAGTGTLYIRFRFSSDTNTEENGWLIDDISIILPANFLAPLNLAGECVGGITELSWDTPASELDDQSPLLGFTVYRDDEAVSELVATTSFVEDITTLDPGDYTYYVTAVYEDRESDPSDPVVINWDGNAVGENGLPMNWAVSSPWPNPFNPSFAVQVSMPEAAKMNIALYNVLGQQVAMINQGVMQAGVHNISVDNSTLASGLYILRVQGGQLNQTFKVVMMK